MRQKMHPKLTEEFYYLDNSILGNLTEENFLLGFYIKNEKSDSILKNKYFETKFYYVDENDKYIHLKFKNCTELASPKINYTAIFRGFPEYLKN